MSLAHINDNTVDRARVQVPAWGAWWADVDLPTEVTLSSSVTFTLADIELQGTVVSGGVFDQRSAYRIVGGAGGWGKTVASKAYANDAGVQQATVINDVAILVGETVAGIPTPRLGPHFARVNGLASRVLHDLAPQAWFIDFAGVTQFGARATTEYTGDGPRVHVDPGVQVIDVATEEIAALVPGVTVDGSAPATDVEYILSPDRLTTRVYAGPRASRRLDAWTRIVDAVDPQRKYRGSFEYRVVTQSGERLNLQPVRAATGLPDLANVPVRPGMAGLKAVVKLGSLVLVTFVDSDPSRPVAFAHDAPDAPGALPVNLVLDASTDITFGTSSDPVIRKSDFDSWVSTFNSHTHPTAATGAPSPPTVPGVGPSGSSKVFSE